MRDCVRDCVCVHACVHACVCVHCAFTTASPRCER